jgi:hypothetical protein
VDELVIKKIFHPGSNPAIELHLTQAFAFFFSLILNFFFEDMILPNLATF